MARCRRRPGQPWRAAPRPRRSSRFAPDRAPMELPTAPQFGADGQRASVGLHHTGDRRFKVKCSTGARLVAARPRWRGTWPPRRPPPACNSRIDEGIGSAFLQLGEFLLHVVLGAVISELHVAGLYPLLGWCRADLQQHEPPAGPSRLLADVTEFLFSECRIGAGRARRGGAELRGRPQPPGRRKNSCSAPPSSRAPQIHPRNPEAADRCRPKDRRRRTTPGTGTEPPPARTRRAFSLTFRVGLYPLLGWCRADLQQHEPPARPTSPIPF